VNALQALAIFAAGIVAGTVNVIVGSGTLVTFPLLLAFGYAPVTANVSNTLGLVPGSLSGVHGYRSELRGQRARALRLGAASLTGGLLGALALAILPASAFKAIVPAFIVIALVLVIAQPRLAERLRRHRARDTRPAPPGTFAAVLGAGVYGGYFGAAQGILLLGILGISIDDDLQRLNGLKNLLAATVNLTAGIAFIVLFKVAWGPALLLMGGSVLGGQVGARAGRRLSPTALRGLIVVVGIIAIVRLLV